MVQTLAGAFPEDSVRDANHGVLWSLCECPCPSKKTGHRGKKNLKAEEPAHSVAAALCRAL